MDFTNINVSTISITDCRTPRLQCYCIQDPAGVSALLETLRSSQAWLQVQADSNQPNAVPPAVPAPSQAPAFLEGHTVQVPNDSPVPSSSGSSAPSVSSLLSQLWPTSSAPPPLDSAPLVSQTDTQISLGGHDESFYRISYPPVNKSRVNFQQALPQIAQLSTDPAFIDKVDQVSTLFHFTVA